MVVIAVSSPCKNQLRIHGSFKDILSPARKSLQRVTKNMPCAYSMCHGQVSDVLRGMFMGPPLIGHLYYNGLKLTVRPLKIGLLVFQASIFRYHLSFREGSIRLIPVPYHMETMGLQTSAAFPDVGEEFPQTMTGPLHPKGDQGTLLPERSSWLWEVSLSPPQKCQE